MRQVAVKVIKEIPGAQVHTIERKLKRERTTWALLRHPNILPLLGFANDDEIFQPFGALISPWRAQGNASVFLKDRGEELTKDHRLNMWKGVVAGVGYLHNHTPALVHGDLKLANVMIDDEGQPQLCDFGLSSIFLEEGHSGMTTTSPHTGTDRYLAYELVRDDDTVIPTVASDIFALGCVGLEFYFLKLPYAHRQNNMQGRIFADIKAGIPPAAREPVCETQSKAVWDLLEHCWAMDPCQRPTARELLASLQFRRDAAELPKHGIEGAKLTRDVKKDNSSWPPPRAQGGMFIGRVDGLGTSQSVPLSARQALTSLLPPNFADNTADIIRKSDINSEIQGGAAGPWSAGQSQQNQVVQGGAPRDVNFSHRSDAVGTVLDTVKDQAGRSLQGIGSWPQDQNTTRVRLTAEQVQAAYRTYLGTAGGNGAYSNLGDDLDNRHWQQPYNGSSLNLEQGDGTGVLRAGGSIQWGESPSNLGRKNSTLKQKQLGQQQQFQQPNSAQHLNPPISPHSPHFGANVPGVGSPTIGLLHSQHSLSPYSLSPHSGPRPAPSPELGGPNVAGGYGGSVHSSPGLGLGGMAGSGELQLVMDPGQNAMQLGNMGAPDNGVQYAQAYANDVPLTGTTNEFGMTQISGSSGFPGSAASDPSWATEQQVHMSDMGMGSWPQDQNATGFQLTTELVQATYGINLGTADGNGTYSQNPPASVQANMGDELDTLYRDPVFWQEPFNGSSLNPEQGGGNYTINFGAKQEEDDIIKADGPGLKLRWTLPTVKGHRQTLSAIVPSFAVEDWSDRAQVQAQYPRLVGSQSYQGPPAVSHGAAPLHDNYPPQQPGPSIYAISGHQSNPQQPPFNHTRTYPPPNPVPDLPLAGPSSLRRNNSNSKQKQQGQRNEVDERKLAEAFMPGSFRNDPALRYFLDLLRTCSFYLEDEHEPLLGTPEAEHLFAQVRGRYPHDVRFAPRNDSRFSSQPLDNETRDSQSIFMLLTENNQCLICGAQKDRTGRVLGHVRSDLGHRPYHCTCEKCMQSANPRRFLTDNLLDGHLKGQQLKRECIYCHKLFRRGGMKRHLTSKHPEHAQSAQGNQDED